uniref:Midgut cathepsin D-like protein CatD2 n=1 Tax=Dysdercus peruvianus TaxID=685034 RepID=A0A1J0KGN6_9HEMI|nr:midgut cathepsin D-like protein CatD2 [Dysdercus peruvianus]
MWVLKVFGFVVLLASCAHTDAFIQVQLKKSLDDSWMIILKEAVAKAAHRFNSSLSTHLTPRFEEFKYLQHYTKIGIGDPEQTFDFTFNPIYRMVLVPSVAHKKKCGGTFKAYDEPSSHTYQDIHESFVSNEGFKLNAKVTEDTFHIGKLNVSDQSFGLITEGPCRKSVYDGVIGLGFSKNHLTLLDNMSRLGTINSTIAGLYLDKDVRTTLGGEVALGDWNRKLVKNHDLIDFIPIVNTQIPAWQIHIPMSFIGETQISFDRYAILDTTSYFIDVPAYEAEIIAKEIQAWNYDGNLIVDCDRTGILPNITLVINQRNYTLQAKDYVDHVNNYKGSCIVLIRSTKDKVWTLGGAFLGNFYTIFHYETKKLAFAELLPKNQGNIAQITFWLISSLSIFGFLQLIKW